MSIEYITDTFWIDSQYKYGKNFESLQAVLDKAEYWISNVNTEIRKLPRIIINEMPGNPWRRLELVAKYSNETVCKFHEIEHMAKYLLDTEYPLYKLNTELLKSDLCAGTCKVTINGCYLQNLFGEKKNIEELKGNIQERYEEWLLSSDYQRGNIPKYNRSRLTDENPEFAGVWEPYDISIERPQNAWRVRLNKKIPVRNAKQDIVKGGICAIDFGTKSTVAVCKKGSSEQLVRLGCDSVAGNTLMNFENPTAIQFQNIERFIRAYKERSGRPFTLWNDLPVSYAAVIDAEADIRKIRAVFNSMKQWAADNELNTENYRKDYKGKEIKIQNYLNLKSDDIDPIEIYAYYLGLAINNIDNGVYMEYTLSFPVNYVKEVREKLRKSFEKGLRKSLPPSILTDKAIMDNYFAVKAGVSEPAAYAACALKELGKKNNDIRPSETKSIFYGIFDFGGGTTDFDYGVWRLPKGSMEEGYNFVLEQYYASGDIHLGGEKLLQRLAYMVYRDNVLKMREQNICIMVPKEENEFGEAKGLLNSSEEARVNLCRLSEKLRVVWERPDKYEKIYNRPLSIKLLSNGKEKNLELRVLKENVDNLLKDRIKRGVDNFFKGAERMFEGYKGQIERFEILLAGNSSKSEILKQIITDRLKKDGAEKIYKLHQPLSPKGVGTEYDRYPNGKTGVAFGLLDCHRSANDVLVINNNKATEGEDLFKYYIGKKGRYDKFIPVINRGSAYDEWIPFIKVNETVFDLYYSSEASSVNNEFDIETVKLKRCRIEAPNKNKGTVFIKKVSPNQIEYVLGEIRDNKLEFLSEIKDCTLN